MSSDQCPYCGSPPPCAYNCGQVSETLAAIRRLALKDLDATSDEELRSEIVADGGDPDAYARFDLTPKTQSFGSSAEVPKVCNKCGAALREWEGINGARIIGCASCDFGGELVSSKELSLPQVITWLRVQGGQHEGPNMFDRAADILIGKADETPAAQSNPPCAECERLRSLLREALPDVAEAAEDLGTADMSDLSDRIRAAVKAGESPAAQAECDRLRTVLSTALRIACEWYDDYPIDADMQALLDAALALGVGPEKAPADVALAVPHCSHPAKAIMTRADGSTSCGLCGTPSGDGAAHE